MGRSRLWLMRRWEQHCREDLVYATAEGFFQRVERRHLRRMDHLTDDGVERTSYLLLRGGSHRIYKAVGGVHRRQTSRCEGEISLFLGN